MSNNKQLLKHNFFDIFNALNHHDLSSLNNSVNNSGIVIDENNIVRIVVRDKIFIIDRQTLNKSTMLKNILETNTQNNLNIISLDEDPNLFKHLIKYMKHYDYVYPHNLKIQLIDLHKKYSIIDDIYIEKILLPKAKLYIDSDNGNINAAFVQAMCEDDATIKNIYMHGVDINFDIDNQSNANSDKELKSNLFHDCINAWRVCNPYFLEMMFRFEREDIDTNGQYVFKMACAYGDNRHIDVFVNKYNIYKWDIFDGMKFAVMHNNLANLNHLIMYYTPNCKEINALFKLAYDHSDDPKIVSYLYCKYDIVITKEILIDVIINCFIDVLSIVLSFYSNQKHEDNQKFIIDKDIIAKVLTRTHDRFIKLKILDKYGFSVENLNEIIANKSLPVPSKIRK